VLPPTKTISSTLDLSNLASLKTASTLSNVSLNKVLHNSSNLALVIVV